MLKFYIGSDESLKGDTFGGIVVAGVLVDDEQKKKLTAIGVMDSKKITNEKIPILAKKIREICPDFAVRNLTPIEYNQHKLTQLLNQLHSECAEIIKEKHLKENDYVVDSSDDESYAHYTHIVDEYPGCNVGDIKKPKAESLYVEVAAASILAREGALKQIDELSKQLGFKVPMGSTHVSDALFQLKVSGKAPEHFVKIHFKNVQEALGSTNLKNQGLYYKTKY